MNEWMIYFSQVTWVTFIKFLVFIKVWTGDLLWQLTYQCATVPPFKHTTHSPSLQKASHSNPHPLFSNCMQNDVTSVHCCWSSFRKKNNCILLTNCSKMSMKCLLCPPPLVKMCWLKAEITFLFWNFLLTFKFVEWHWHPSTFLILISNSKTFFNNFEAKNKNRYD